MKITRVLDIYCYCCLSFQHVTLCLCLILENRLETIKPLVLN